MVFAFDKFPSYLLRLKVILHIDHLLLRYWITKKDSKPRLIRYVFFLREFVFMVKDQKGIENKVVDLSRLEDESLLELGNG